MPPFRQGLTPFRTDVTDPAPKSSATHDPAEWCVVQKLSHPLSKCLAFKAMPLTERKNLLSQHGICFHCLAATNHLAKDCTTQIKCFECHSDKHVTALRTGPPNKPAEEEVELEDAHQHGGEPTAISNWTQVCRSTSEGKSCAKICLANVYANSQPEKKLKHTWSLMIKTTVHWPSQNCLICWTWLEKYHFTCWKRAQDKSSQGKTRPKPCYWIFLWHAESYVAHPYRM